MTVYDFIFSSKKKHRFSRHAAFWTMYYAGTVVIYLPDVKMKALTVASLYTDALKDALFFLPVYLLAVYFTTYYILPRYLAKKSTGFLIMSSFSMGIVIILSGYFITNAFFKMNGWEQNQLDIISFEMHRCVANLITITSLAVIIKIMKDFSLRQRENEMLSIKNIRNKLHLLKIQMHPDILFECLRKIYEDIDRGTKDAPEMILKLSELLNYLLYEAEQEQVRLITEVKMIRNYIELKKMGYKNKPDIFFEISGETDNDYISPGIFLPLLETGINPFHKEERNLSVLIELKITESKLYFIIKNNINGIQIMESSSAREIIRDIKKKLQTSQLHKYKIEAHSHVESFAIILQIEKDKTVHLQNKII